MRAKRGMFLFAVVWTWLGVSAAMAQEQAPAEKVEAKDPLEFGNRNTFWGRPTLQYRLRPEARVNGDLDKDTFDDTLVGLQRARAGLKLNYDSWLETFVQFQDVRTFGYMNSSVAHAGNTGLHQGWVKFKLLEGAVSLKIGRQHLVYGDQRLIGHLEWANTPRVFDALVLRVNNRVGWTDAFASVFSSDPGGNMLRYATVFTGLYNEVFFANKAVVWDQYVLGLFDGENARAPGVLFDPDDDEAVNPGRRIVTLGTRARYNGRCLSAGIEAAYQLGKRNYDADIDQSAFAIHGDVKYQPTLPTRPYVKVGGNYATGENSDADVATRFINLFPTNHLFYGFMDLASWSNAVNLNAGLGFSPHKKVTVMADYWMLARAETGDGWYNAGGKALLPAPDPLNPTEYDDDMLLGHELDLTIKIPILKQVSTMGGVSMFLPAGYALAKGDDPQVWAFVMLAVSI